MSIPYPGAQKATQKSSVLSKSSWRKFAHFLPIARFAYSLLHRIVLSHNFQETFAVGNRVANLLSPIVALEDCFDSLPSGVAEQRRQKGLIRYAAVPSLLPTLIPP